MSVQQININQTRDVTQQKNKKLLSVKQYSDCTEKTYLVPAITQEQKLTPVLYSAILPGMGQSVNGEKKKAKKIIGINASLVLLFLAGCFMCPKNIKGKAEKKGLYTAAALMAVSIMSLLANWVYGMVDAYKNAKTEVVEVTKN